jgi:hypothetical protein
MSVIAADESARAAGRRRARAVSRKPRSEGEGDEAEAETNPARLITTEISRDGRTIRAAPATSGRGGRFTGLLVIEGF